VTILEPAPLDQLPTLPSQPAGVPWPTRDWPTGALPEHVDPAELEALIDRAFGPEPDAGFGASHALVVVHEGRIVAERYGTDIGPDTPLLSWSMAKSVIHALVGILVQDGRLDPAACAPIDAWQGARDPRARITLQHLLRMTDGLEFNEDYALPSPDTDPSDVRWSHCIDMLFGSGTDDVAGYAIDRPARHEPGAVFNYSSGTSNIIARIIGNELGGNPERVRSFMHDRLFQPIGIRTADPSFDAAGTFVGSSYLHMTARDWARFGLLYLRGGEWDGETIVPRAWVDDCRRAWAVDDEGNRYGTHWWVGTDGRGSFWCSGFEIQRVICVPRTDLVVVRLGRTPQEHYDTPRVWLEQIIALFD